MHIRGINATRSKKMKYWANCLLGRVCQSLTLLYSTKTHPKQYTHRNKSRLRMPFSPKLNSFIPKLLALVIMAALWNRAGHYIFLRCGFFYLLFFPRLISAVADWMSAILPHMV